MPGIIGFTRKEHHNAEKEKIELSLMRNLITHKPFYKLDELFCDKNLCATRSHINIIPDQLQPASFENNIYVWLDGEIYNQGKLIQNAIEMSDAKLLLKLYIKDKTLSFLSKIDGFFSAVIYDTKDEKLHIINDRYGLRHIYWAIIGGSLAWSSEVKAFIALADFIPKIDSQAIKEFFSIGYLLENRTWFENVQLLPSGTVLTWNFKLGSYSQHQYWWWDRIVLQTGKINEQEVISELGSLFIDAVKRRCLKGNIHVGLTLSGGLDSRAILAAIPNLDYSVNACTFGLKDCDDIRIAAKAAKIKGAVYHILELDHINWLSTRLKGVWWTDGQLSMQHMHGIEFGEQIRNLFQCNLNGFSGDAVLGGSFFRNNLQILDAPISKFDISKWIGCDINIINDNDMKKYSGLEKHDYYYLQNRVRRFTFMGTKHSLINIENRKPFYDNNLIEYIYSLPDSLRFKSYIYKKMLLSYFPEFYESIPWQKTGLPINCSKTTEFLFALNNRISSKLSSWLKLKNSRSHTYVDYQNWIRSEPAISVFKKVLVDDSQALYPDFIDRNIVIDQLDRHLKGENFSNNLCLYLTFEIWLQQIYNGNYRE